MKTRTRTHTANLGKWQRREVLPSTYGPFNASDFGAVYYIRTCRETDIVVALITNAFRYQNKDEEYWYIVKPWDVCFEKLDPDQFFKQKPKREFITPYSAMFWSDLWLFENKYDLEDIFIFPDE